MNTTSDFSTFWHLYITIIVVASFIGLAWLLISQNKAPKRGEENDTTGHNWDGIEEYNNPLPRWWFYLFVLTVVFGIGYLAYYPGFGSFKGFGNWTSHNQYEGEMQKARERYQPIYAQFANMSIPEIAQNKEAQAIGQNLFNTYCIQCHGSDARGAKGFPNLTDKDWLWGGDPETIADTIRGGRVGIMLPYGGLPPFPEESVKDVVSYIYSLNENEHWRKRANPERAARGKQIYDQICFTCHQADGKGMQGLAPNLTDDVWLWGGRENDLIQTITHGHTNEMPSWEHFLVETNANGEEDVSKLRILTAYVWGLGGGQHPEGEEEAVVNDDGAKIIVDNDMVKFYFAVGSANVGVLPTDEVDFILKGAADGKMVVLSGFHDKTGDPEMNAELAKQRAMAVKDALVQAGVPEASIELRKPESAEDDGNLEEARRVEVTLQ